MENDKRQKLEIATLKRQLKRAQRHIKKLENIARIRKQAYIDIRDDVSHVCGEWLECLSILGKNWRSRFLAQKAWFDYSMDIFPVSPEDLMDKMKQSRLFENGEIPKIKNL
ncbi:MAG: hypothetical protein Q7K65_03550 [Candidatus Buchananbacteria bacterium]|nr:hypothetical protein [Candidatus Buchananbacteria bacterium]